ncbi:hypothetical protein [Paenibacillus sabinae]|uniref:hypothetical protein n=1 Tax=Paenibacillus sabinae TaxID=365617 RepID=UPI00046D8389|nr:hypothetical protein [Paenibacillus sabinae]
MYIATQCSRRFGIQARGGCSCAGPYGHYLLSIDKEASIQMGKAIRAGDQSLRPGWVRLSLHPVMTSGDVAFILLALKAIVSQREVWQADYRYSPATNCWRHRSESEEEPDMERLFAL